MVQASRLSEIRRDWERRGSPLCTHDDTDKEYDLGSQSGDRGCLNCGDSWWAQGPKPAPTGGE